METSWPHTESARSWPSALKHIVGERSFCVVLLGLVLLSGFFWLLPDTGLDASGLFHRKAGSFFLGHDYALELVRRIRDNPSRAPDSLLVIGLVLTGLALTANRGDFIRRAVFLIGLMLVGPRLPVNLALKENCGRARPARPWKDS